jgi:hypothetical protein
MSKEFTIEDAALVVDEDSKAKGWRGKDFRFGKQLEKMQANGEGDAPGETADRDANGRPRALDFENYSSVDWSLYDSMEDFS